MPAEGIDVEIVDMYELDLEVDAEGIVASRERLVKRL
jgi:hypothetical protein